MENPDFSDGLAGWTVGESGGGGTPGTVAVIEGKAQLLEGDSFLVMLQQTFTVPQNPGVLSFTKGQNPGFDQSVNFIPDAFEVSLLSSTSFTLVKSWKPAATSFFNLQENGTTHLGSHTSFDGTR